MFRLMSGEYAQNGNPYSMSSKEEMKELGSEEEKRKPKQYFLQGKGRLSPVGMAEYSVANTCYLRTDVFQISLQKRQHLISLKTAASALLLFPDQAHASPARAMRAKRKEDAISW